MGRGLVTQFVVGALVGVVAAVALGVVLRPQIPSTAGQGTPVSLTDGAGSEIDFQLVDSNPTPLEPLPDTATIQLTAFHPDGASPGPDGAAQDPWWKNSVPRIDAITQFDGGPLQKVNCLMAAAAMLARLGYGVVSTGSQMRALSGDTDLGTTYQNVQDAIRKGWNIRFFQGALTPVQLRAVLWAGAGAIIDGVYGEIPVGVRLQASFTGRHAIYVDAFRPAGPNNQPEAAYYVMDPIGRTWNGYKGGWWPADDVERFAAQLPGRRIATMWAFPGGKAPANRPVLPKDAYPSRPPNTTPDPSAPADPYPPDEDDPLPPQPPDGEDPGFDPPFAEQVDILDADAEIYPGFNKCALDPAPLFCPKGIVGVIDLDGLGPPPTRPPRVLDILYGSVIGPGMYQIIFEPPPDSTRAELWFWSDAAGSRLQAATVEEGTLGGKTVAIGTIALDPAIDYQFVATAEGDGVRTLSNVGALEVKQ